MKEHYSYTGEKESFEKLSLTEQEQNSIKRIGLTIEDLGKLLHGQPFAEGSYAMLFGIPDQSPSIVAKAWKNRERDSGRGKNENVALRLLRRRRFKNAPKLKGYLQPSTILFEEKIEGETVKEFDSTQIERLAAALASLHSIELTAYGKPLEKRKKGTQMDFLLDGMKILQKISEPFADQTEVTDLIHRSLKKIQDQAQNEANAFSATHFTLIHFDLSKNNIIFAKAGGDPVIVDWEQASAGDSAMDIAKLFLKSDFTEVQKQVFLKAYESRQTDTDPHFSSA